jgi:hypothetical protein
MRKLGYILLILGFLWVTFVAVECFGVAHAITVDRILKKPTQQTFTRDEVATVSIVSKTAVRDFAALGFGGGLLMLAGGIILDASGRRQPNTY